MGAQYCDYGSGDVMIKGRHTQDLKLVDQTRGILTWVTDNVPGNFHKEVGYATVRSTTHPASAYHPQLINDDRDEQSHVWACLGTTPLSSLSKDEL